MTDKELLELAAKAAGIFVTREEFERDCKSPWDQTWEILEYDDEEKSISGWQTIYSYNGELSGWGVISWSPLTDDGDALRLAAKLIIDIEWATEYIVFANGNYSDDIKNHGNDHTATVRSVIVRAAAEIGKAMP